MAPPAAIPTGEGVSAEERVKALFDIVKDSQEEPAGVSDAGSYLGFNSLSNLSFPVLHLSVCYCNS